MFIAPPAQRAEPYPCATTAFIGADGEEGPVIGDDGQAIPDQVDTSSNPRPDSGRGSGRAGGRAS
jgi:hypothetical protein